MANSKEVKKLDRIFSQYIRKKDLKNECNRCYTCKKIITYEETDAGHYITRQHMATRFDERNVKPQCRRCNRFQSGCADEFALHLLEDYGADVLAELNQAKWTPTKVDDLTIIGMQMDYKERLKKIDVQIS